MFNPTQKLDRNFEEVSGVSPIRCRHDTDLYGLKDGVGKFNPIMVENINKIPEPDEYEDPEILKKQKSPLKSSQKPNMQSSAKSPGTAKTGARVEKTKSKLILSNQGGPPKRDFSQFEMPATFST